MGRLQSDRRRIPPDGGPDLRGTGAPAGQAITISKQDPLEALISALGSLDAEERLSSLEELKRYAGTRKVDQAVFGLRNDGDRRVRALARQILEEADQRVSSALAVPGAEKAEAESHLSDLLDLFRSDDPTDRVSALKELRTINHPKAIEAVEKARKDPNRVVRQLAELATEERTTGSGRRPAVSRFEGNVMLAGMPDPAAGDSPTAGPPSWPQLVPLSGFLYLLGGVPTAIVCLWLWLGEQHIASGALAPDPALAAVVESILRIQLQPMILLLGFVVGGAEAVIGVGLVSRQEWGRKGAVSFHALLAVLGLFLPELLAKVLQFAFHVAWMVLYSRPVVIQVFQDPNRPAGPPPPAKYGNMERRSW